MRVLVSLYVVCLLNSGIPMLVSHLVLLGDLCLNLEARKSGPNSYKDKQSVLGALKAPQWDQATHG